MRFRLAHAALGLAIANGACGGGSLGTPSPIVDTDQAIDRARRNNPFPVTSVVRFEWSFRDPNADVSLDGVGTARLQHPDLARLDLFMDNNEAVLAASLVEDQLRAREGTRLELVPSPALLWAFLGTFRPGDDATWLGGEAFDDDDLMRLRYRLADGDELRYEFRSGRMTRVELRHEGEVDRVALNWEGGGGLPSEATYRYGLSSELKVTVETVERVDSHPSDIWYSIR